MKILAITGYKTSGKDYTAKRLKEHFNWKHFERVAFADPLKQEVASALNMSVEFIEQNKEAVRPLLQAWGTVKKEETLGFTRDYWSSKAAVAIHLANKRLTEDGVEDPIFVITDLRYPYEVEDLIENLRKHGNTEIDCKVVRVNNSYVHNLDLHSSETSVDRIKADFYVTNNYDKNIHPADQRDLSVPVDLLSWIA